MMIRRKNPCWNLIWARSLCSSTGKCQSFRLNLKTRIKVCPRLKLSLPLETELFCKRSCKTNHSQRSFMSGAKLWILMSWNKSSVSSRNKRRKPKICLKWRTRAFRWTDFNLKVEPRMAISLMTNFHSEHSHSLMCSLNQKKGELLNWGLLIMRILDSIQFALR